MDYITNSGASLDQATQAGTIVLALSAAVAVGDLIAGYVGYDVSGGASITSIVDNLGAGGNAYVKHNDDVDDATNTQRGGTFHCVVTKAGTPTITITFSTSRFSRRMMLMAYTGQDIQFHGIDVFHKGAGQLQASPGTGTDAVTSTAIVPTLDGCLVCGYHQLTGGPADTVTAGTGFNSRVSDGLGNIDGEDLMQSTAAPIAATFTLNTDHRLICQVVAYRPRMPGGIYDDRYRKRESVFWSGTSTLGTKRSAHSEDQRDFGMRDSIADTNSRMF